MRARSIVLLVIVLLAIFAPAVVLAVLEVLLHALGQAAASAGNSLGG
jgi:hypothetical protein